MKSLSDILEGILDKDLDSKIDDKLFPPEIDEMIKLWGKIELRPQPGTSSHVLGRAPQGGELRSYLDGHACKAYKKTFELLKKCDCERVSKSEAQNCAKYKDDVVIIKAESQHVGIYICNAKTEECLRIIEDEAYDNDRRRVCRAVFVKPTHISNIWPTYTSNSEQYMIITGTLWESIKKALSAK